MEYTYYGAIGDILFTETLSLFMNSCFRGL
jgi:hypothetical protein